MALAVVEGGGRAEEGKNNRRPHLDRAGPPRKIKLNSEDQVDGRSRRHSLSLSTFRPRLNELEVDQHYDNYDDGLLLCTNLVSETKKINDTYRRNIVLYRACLITQQTKTLFFHFNLPNFCLIYQQRNSNKSGMMTVKGDLKAFGNDL